MTPLIARDELRFDPIYGDTRHRVPPRRRSRRSRMMKADVQPVPVLSPGREVRQFLAAFAGGFVFFSILIF